MMELSVITITKNSEGRIGQVVGNALQLGDESIVVDTGSSDNTIKEAEAAGARVFQFEGEFDFSAPRNFAEKHAKGEWFLHLDTDECINVSYRDEIRRKVRQGRFKLFLLYQLNYGDGPLPTITALSRLLKRDQFKWHGMVYNWVYPYQAAGVLDVVIENRRRDNPESAGEINLRSKTLFARENEQLNLNDPKSLEELIIRISRNRFLNSITNLGPAAMGAIQDDIADALVNYSARDLTYEGLCYEMGYFFDSLGDRESAYNMLKRMPVEAIQSPLYLSMLAFMAQANGMPLAECIAIIDRAIDLDPCFQNQSNKIYIYKQAGCQEEALRQYEIATAILPQLMAVNDKWEGWPEGLGGPPKPYNK